MEAHVMKLENNYVIVDEEYFDEIKKKAEFNQERVNGIAEERFLKSVSEKVKHVIADDITEALNDKFKGLKDEALNYASSEFDKRKHGLEATAKIWKCLALIFFHYDYCFNNCIIYMIMTEELVTLETAKLLKAAGFKEDVNSFYELVYKGGSGPEYEIDESYDAQNYNTDVYYISKADMGTVLYCFPEGPNDAGNWDTYEEALEAGIQKALKLII